MRALIYALALLAAFPASADIVLSVGAGKGIIGGVIGQGRPFEREGTLGYQFNWGDLFVRPQVGYFADLSDNGKSSSWVTSLLGVQATSDTGLEVHLGLGPSYLAHPDQVLGGPFQFTLEGGVGLKGKRVYIGGAWTHISSAWIYQPNLGRDFIGAQVRFFL